MNRSGKVFFQDVFAGIISEDENGYKFEYDDEFLKNNLDAISLTIPKTKKIFTSKTMFSFFDGLIPEGWLLDIAVKNWKLNPRDRMGLLLAVCRDCIGAVSIIPVEEN